jgi:endonuclease/exonuclease/phosphatase family metal-dependent hydrolase
MVTQSLRLISWNVRQSTGIRLAEQVGALAAQNPDILALQEVTKKSVSQFRDALAHIGLQHTVDSFQLATDSSLLRGPRRYGELLASRWPLTTLPPEGFAVPWPERVLSAICQSPWGLIEIHTTHIPPGASNGWVKIETLEGIFNRLACQGDHPRILCGDFNTPQAEKPDGRTLTWGQVEKSTGLVRIVEQKKGGSGERWHLGEYNVLRGLAQFDLPDVFRLLHGYDVQEFSWYWKAKGRVVGRRFDHVFASRRLNLIECRYLHSLREQSLSDHSPIQAIFTPHSQ